MDNVTRLLMQGAAGAAGGGTYVDDVFSTYLWKGNNQNGRPISNGIKLNNDSVGNSVYFNGTGQIEIASTSDFAFGTGDYTVEFWINYSSVADYMSIFEGRPTNSNGEYFSIQINGGNLQVYINSTNTIAVTAPATSQWHHIAVVREGTGSNQLKLYINGTQSGQATDTANYGNQRCLIAGHAWSRGSFYGNLSNYRVTKGQALYTSNFTPSTQALTTTSQGATASNVKLLCCQSSTSATVATKSPSGITETGSVQSQLFGPFTGNDGEGGMVWVKNRTQGGSGWESFIADTVRGNARKIYSSETTQQSIDTTGVRYFTNNGFIVNDSTRTNYNNHQFTSWTFRKQKGFFDVVEYTGTGSARTVDHNLGSIPGMILIKRLDASADWLVYHRNAGGSNPGGWSYLFLNTTAAVANATSIWNDTDPTSSVFSVGTDNYVNANGGTYIAYLFAGGESTAATARSVDFDGSNDGLSATSSDLVLGTGDFTVECWWKYEGGNTDRIISMDKTSNPTNRWIVYHHQGNIRLNINGSDVFFSSFDMNDTTTWHHLAIVKHNNKTRLYTDGRVKPSQYNPTNNEYADTLDYQSDQIHIGMEPNGGNNLNGKVSNVRVVAGTAVYTSSFRPPTEPLKNITNTKLLCCNNSSVTGKTVGPTITATDSPTASTDSPFDDPAAFTFGDSEEGIVKCGSYVGNGSDSNPVGVYLGFEPQFLLIKRTDTTSNWQIIDSMRGFPVDGNNWSTLRPNTTDAETDSYTTGAEPTATGFNLVHSWTDVNASGGSYIFCAIRRPDGYVGKPPELGTGVFTVVNSATDGNSPWMRTSNHIVDYQFFKLRNGADNWWTSSRLTQGKYLYINRTDAEAANQYQMFDYMDGYNSGTDTSGNYTGWLWKRHAGFDVVNYVGNQTMGHQIPHSLGQPPEMIWTKNKDQIQQWSVGHKGLNGGTNPWNWVLVLSDAEAEQEATNFWEAPTATHFTVGSDARVNKNNLNYLAILFSSVEGISKVGSYTGSSSALTITTGFQPRFVIIKNVVDTGYNWTTGWFVFDTMRGWASGNNDKRMRLNDNAAQTTEDWTDPTSTGFTINANSGNHLNHNGERYIYYAHA